MQHEPEHLRQYLVSGVEDPRLNVQSVLTRHFLLRELFGDGFERLMLEELRFAAVLNWLLTLRAELDDADLRAALLYALRKDADNAEGLIVPRFLSETFRLLPVSVDSRCPVPIPNYLEDLLHRKPECSEAPLDRQTLGTFERLWQEALRSMPPDHASHLSALEPACGSANEYRFIKSYGITPFIDYAGFDLCEKNVLNARLHFPAARFEAGNVFEINAPNQSFDLCFLHDLLEHLSIAGLHCAIGELCRVTRAAISIGFFQMHEGTDHIVRQVDDYHWNTLSMELVRSLFENQGFEVQVIHIATFLNGKFACEYTHNRDAYTLVMRRKE